MLIRMLLSGSLFFSLKGTAQDFSYTDRIYSPTVKSVTFHPLGMGIAAAVSDVEGNTPLLLTFDDLTYDARRFVYRIIHCDFDWEPSELMEMEYVQGYTEDDIRQFAYSSKTTRSYVHYELTLPNANTRWTRSGNYLLVVFEDEDRRIPVITRRFVVVDNQVQIDPSWSIPAQASGYRTHQELDFMVRHPRLNIRQPMQEIRATVVQNGQWANALVGMVPFQFGNQYISFDHQGKIVFAGGNEFRQLDLRSLWQRTGQMADLVRSKTSTEVVLFRDRLRGEEPYFQNRDINGRFFLETRDQGNPLASDYAQVLFTLDAPEPFLDKEVYLLGAFNDWLALPEYKMIHSEADKGYILKKPLKQGFYNYAFGMTTSRESRPDLRETEGSFYETENEYLVFIYYRPFGARADEVIGYLQVQSGR